MQRMEIAELDTTEGTVVEGKPNQAENPSQGVQAHRVDLVSFPKPAQLKIMAGRAVRVPLEHCKDHAIVVPARTAVFTTKRRAAKNPADNAAALPGIQFSAMNTPGVDSPEKHETSKLLR
jgi:hypothetical protein